MGERHSYTVGRRVSIILSGGGVEIEGPDGVVFLTLGEALQAAGVLRDVCDAGRVAAGFVGAGAVAEWDEIEVGEFPQQTLDVEGRRYK